MTLSATPCSPCSLCVTWWVAPLGPWFLLCAFAEHRQPSSPVRASQGGSRPGDSGVGCELRSVLTIASRSEAGHSHSSICWPWLKQFISGDLLGVGPQTEYHGPFNMNTGTDVCCYGDSHMGTGQNHGDMTEPLPFPPKTGPCMFLPGVPPWPL